MYLQIITKNKKDIVIRSGKRCVDFQQTVIQTNFISKIARLHQKYPWLWWPISLVGKTCGVRDHKLAQVEHTEN